MLQEHIWVHCAKRMLLSCTSVDTFLTNNRERTDPLPNGWFNWIGPFWKMPDTYALQHQSLDAYLFLRFLRMTVVIMFVGACMTWPTLYVPPDPPTFAHLQFEVTFGE